MTSPPLPESVQEIADVIGRDKALSLIANLPRCWAKDGSRKPTRVILYVPKVLPFDHRLVKLLGWDDANKLVKAFGGEILQPGSCAYVLAAQRNAEFLRKVTAGECQREAAKAIGISERTARRILAAKPQEAMAQAANDNAECTRISA